MGEEIHFVEDVRQRPPIQPVHSEDVAVVQGLHQVRVVQAFVQEPALDRLTDLIVGRDLRCESGGSEDGMNDGQNTSMGIHRGRSFRSVRHHAGWT
jgi:hypothetical protein